MAVKETNFYQDKIFSFEEFFAGDNITDSLNICKIIDGVSSIPMYERLGIDKDMLDCDEQQLMDSEALMFRNKHQDELTKKEFWRDEKTLPGGPSIISNEFVNERDDNSKNVKSQLHITCDDELDETFNSEAFLNYIYSINGKDYPISTFQKNINFDICPSKHKILEPEKEIISGIPKDFKDFLEDISNGKYEQYAFSNDSLEDSPSSSSCSDDEEVIPLKVKELSNHLNMESNDNKYSFMKKIIEDSMKQIVIPEKSQLLLISSESNSEPERYVEKTVQQTIKKSKKCRKSNKTPKTKQEVQTSCSTNNSEAFNQNIKIGNTKTSNEEKIRDISLSIPDSPRSSKYRKHETKSTLVESSKSLHKSPKTCNIDVTEKVLNKNVSVFVSLNKQPLNSETKTDEQKQVFAKNMNVGKYKDPQNNPNPIAVLPIPKTTMHDNIIKAKSQTKKEKHIVNKSPPVQTNLSSDSDEDLSALTTKRLTVVDKIVKKKSNK